MSMKCELDYPVLSVAPGLGPHEVLIGGGAGNGNNGIKQ